MIIINQTFKFYFDMQSSIIKMNPNIILQFQQTSKLLELFHHRNKNQHRRAKWWKWVATLKRCVNKLVEELEASDQARSHSRMTFMKDVLLPKCYVWVCVIAIRET